MPSQEYADQIAAEERRDPGGGVRRIISARQNIRAEIRLGRSKSGEVRGKRELKVFRFVLTVFSSNMIPKEVTKFLAGQ